MEIRASRFRARSLLLIALTIPALGADPCGGPGGGPKVWRVIVDGTEVPGAETGADPLNLLVGKMRIALAPGGEMYIAHMNGGKVLVRDGIFDPVFFLFDEVGGVPLNEPVAIDVGANGDVYVADYGNERIVRYDPDTGTTNVVATTPTAGIGPAEVVVGGDDVLYVGEKADLLGSGGSVWKYTISLDLWEDLFPGEIVNSQGMSLGADGTLYIAAVSGPTAPDDGFICTYDTSQPAGSGCTVIQRNAEFPVSDPASEPAVGPQLPTIFGWPAFAVDVEVDSDGVLYLLSNTHWLFHAWKLNSRGAARNPVIFKWDLPAGSAPVRIFGMADDNWLSNAGQNEIIPDGVVGPTWDKTAQAYDLEAGTQGLLLFTVKGGCCLGGLGQHSAHFQRVVDGDPVYHGTP